MSDPLTEVRNEMYVTMSGYAPLIAVAQVYDEVPQGLAETALPYISLGPAVYTIEQIDCIDGGEIMLQVDVWSNRPGQAEVAVLAGLVRESLKGFFPELSQNALVEFTHERTDFLRDGAIKHASIRFVAIVEEQSAS
jgi:hypothetical protein